MSNYFHLLEKIVGRPPVCERDTAYLSIESSGRSGIQGTSILSIPRGVSIHSVSRVWAA